MRILLLLITLSARALLAEHNPADVLMEADKAFDRDTAARGLEGWMSWFTEDARIEGVQEVIVGKVALRDYYSKMFTEREFRIHWWPVSADMSGDGTLGCAFGWATISWSDEKGDVQKRESRYATLGRRQKDSGYKVVFDIGG